MCFDDKLVSLRKLLSYLNSHNDGLFCCHANHLVFGTRGYFDEQVIRCFTSFNSEKAYWWYVNQRFKFISTHTIVRNSIKLENYKLNTISEYLGIDFEHHDARQDVEAMEKIFNHFVYNDITEQQLLELGDYNYGYR